MNKKIYLKPLPLTLMYSIFGFLPLFFVYIDQHFHSLPSVFPKQPIDPLLQGMEYMMIVLSAGMFLFSYFYVYRNGLKDAKFWEQRK